MSATTRNRKNKRGKLMRRLNHGTDRVARRHQKLEALWRRRAARWYVEGPRV